MKAQNARGTRDFSPIEVKKRSYIIDTIKKYYELYGYLPIETPAIENLSTLTGKYGEEGDQLLFKILNSRLHESKNKELLKEEFNKMLEKPYHSEYITERALRYDLTVPFARYVSQYRHQLTFPFKRYQIQPVWRADKPQKGRYREFVQCDADAIGTNALLMEAELIQLMKDVFEELKLPVILKVNNRKILSGIIDYAGANEKFSEIVTLIDKLDKAEAKVVKDGMRAIGLSEHQIEKIFDILSLKKNNFELLEYLKSIDNSILQKGIDEIYYVLNFYKQNLLQSDTALQRAQRDTEDKMNVELQSDTAPQRAQRDTEDKMNVELQSDVAPQRTQMDTEDKKVFELQLDITLARGLNYYTGIIFEAKANVGNFQPSILGGGRYDDLTGIFDLPNVSGVGISFGIDRIYDVMEEAGLFPSHLNGISPAKILLIYMEETYLPYVFEIAGYLRKNNISTEIYHQKDKLKKCFDYARKKSFPYVGIVGESEVSQRMMALKNMHSGEQQTLNLEQIIQILNNE